MSVSVSLDASLVREYQITLNSPLIDGREILQALGGTSFQEPAVAERYLRMPVACRPQLSIYFDREWYCFEYPDVAESGCDPLHHFLAYGLRELRSPHPLIDLRYIDTYDPTLFEGHPTGCALVKILELGLVDPSPYFSIKHYVRQLPPDIDCDDAALRHFLTVGLRKGLQPHPLLNVFWYAGYYPDAPRDPYEALRHFVMIGDREGRSSSDRFDGIRYFTCNPDIASAHVPALKHFLIHGKAELRQACGDRPDGMAMGTPSAPAPANGKIGTVQIAHKRRTIDDEGAAGRISWIENLSPLPAPIFALDPLDLGAIGHALTHISFPQSSNPRVSILISVYNELSYTLECLLSLQKFASDVAFEVVIADDASTDPAVLRLAGIPNLRLIRQPRNLGFLRNCNAAFAKTRGEYVLLLNNDAQFLGPVAHSLMACLDADREVGGAGPKVIYPNGRLQEAGCNVDPTGRTQMIGPFQSPEEPPANCAREAHCNSGVALMVRRDMVGGALFDEHHMPACCEDADLCVRICSVGKGIHYCPDAVVVRHLSVSMGPESDAKRLQQVSRSTFGAIWQNRRTK